MKSSRSHSSRPSARSKVSSSSRPSPGGQRVGRRALIVPEGLGQLGDERRRHRVDGAQIERHRLQSRVGRGLRHGPEQRRLAHAAGTMDPQHAEGLRGVERRAEQLELGSPPDERAPPRAPQAIGHRRRRRRSGPAPCGDLAQDHPLLRPSVATCSGGAPARRWERQAATTSPTPRQGEQVAATRTVPSPLAACSRVQMRRWPQHMGQGAHRSGPGRRWR